MFIETFRAWRKDVLRYSVLYLVVGVIIACIDVAVTWIFLGISSPRTSVPIDSLTEANPSLLANYAGMILVSGVLGAVASAVFTGAVTYYAISKRRGTPVSWSAALRMGIRSFPGVLGGALLLGVLLAVVVTLLSLALLVQVQNTFTSLFFASAGGFLLLFPLFLFLSLSLFLYAPAVMMERVGAVGSLKRSWSLTRGYRMSIFGALLLVGFASLAVNLTATGLPLLPKDSLGSVVTQIAATAITGSWEVLLAAMAYELIGNEQRDRKREEATLALSATASEKVPAFQAQGAPVCPVCRTSLLWVPAFSRWYCLACGTYR